MGPFQLLQLPAYAGRHNGGTIYIIEHTVCIVQPPLAETLGLAFLDQLELPYRNMPTCVTSRESDRCLE